mgnify:CR=1 FL=1
MIISFLFTLHPVSPFFDDYFPSSLFPVVNIQPMANMEVEKIKPHTSWINVVVSICILHIALFT